MSIKITDTNEYKFTLTYTPYYCVVAVEVEHLGLRLTGLGVTPEIAYKQLQKSVQSATSLLNKIDDSIIYGRDKN